MKTKLLKFTKLHLTKLLSIFFFILLFSSYLSTFAIGQPYNPGETLDPSCAPGDTNCTVTVGGTPSGSSGQIQFNDNGLFAGTADLTWTAGTAGAPFSLGPDITFTRPNSEFPTDIISPSVQLTRGDTKGLYNPLSEPFYDNNTYLSPLGTEWNSAEGWTDLSDISTRTYTTFRDALGGSVNSNILPAELVMHDIAQDTYYKVDFTSWTTNANGGGFAYTRNLIDPTTFALGPDVSFSKADYEIISTPPPTDDVSSFVHITRGSSQSIYNAVTESSYSGGTSPADTEWNSDGWGTLTDVDTRTYTDFNSSLGGNIGNNVLPAELVMHDINDNKYYKVDFTSWTTGGGGGGFSYTRNLINLGTSTENQLTSNSNLLIGGTDRYLNFGTTSGTSGYGVRDVAGVLQYKNDGGSWASLGSSIIGSTSTINAETWLGTSPSNMGTASTDGTVFLGINAGYSATNASNSNFLGSSAGINATNASNSNFLGYYAGSSATDAYTSNFLGYYSGYSATNASNSNFLGSSAGINATNASNSNFLGSSAGSSATNAANSIFIGNQAGYGDTVDNTGGSTSIVIGDNSHAGNFSNSIVLGPSATNTMTNQFLVSPTYSNFRIRDIDYVMPDTQATSAGQVLTNDGSGTLTWASAGGGSLLGSTSTIGTETWLGSGAGSSSGSTNSTVFIGISAGNNATSANFSNFLGYHAGQGASSAPFSNFIGPNAGSGATYASDSNFIGDVAGVNAVNATNSNFLGMMAGYQAANAANSIFIGTNAGNGDVVDNTGGSTSIVIGDNSHAGSFSNSLVLGPNASNTMTNQFLVSPTYYNFRIRDVDYIMPASQGGASTVLTNDGSGILSWASAGGGDSTFATDISVNGLTVGRGGGDIPFNTAFGSESLYSNTTGEANTANGDHSLYSNTTGYSNTASGAQSLYSNTTGTNNTANGTYSLISNTTGDHNTANGSQSLRENTTGNSNTANGYGSLYFNTVGIGNTANGVASLSDNTTGNSNTANGTYSLAFNTIGTNNTALGHYSGACTADCDYHNITSSNSLYLGSNTSALADGDTNEIVIGANATGNGSNTVTLGHTSIVNTYLRGAVNLGTISDPVTPNIGDIWFNGTNLYFRKDGLTSQDLLAGGGLSFASDISVNSITVGRGAGNVVSNTTLGYQALQSNTTGVRNTANGYRSLTSNTTGSQNTASGSYSLQSNTTGGSNTANGDYSLASNTMGYENTASGAYSLQSNTTGSSNTANGQQSLSSNTTGIFNTASGRYSLLSNTIGQENTANGSDSLLSNTTGSFNTASGRYSLVLNTTGIGNTANGWMSLYKNTTASYNTANGSESLYSNTTGYLNTANGKRSLYLNTTGYSNAANGSSSLYNNTVGVENTANGYNSLYTNTTGNYNTAGGSYSLYLNDTGNNNTALGYQAGANQTAGDNNIIIGYNASVPSATGSNQVRIGDTNISYAGVQVAWTITSDQSLKNTIAPTSLGLDFINQLKPVEYLRNGDTSNKKELGLIAQDLRDTLSTYGTNTYGLLQSDDAGILSIRYNDLFSPIIKSIQEMDLRVKGIETISDNSTFTSSLKNWFASAENGIQEIYAKVIRSSDKICINQTCINEAQLIQILNSQNNNVQSSSPIIPPVENPIIETPITETPATGDESPVAPTDTPAVPVVTEVTPEPVIEPVVDPVLPAPQPESTPVIESTPTE